MNKVNYLIKCYPGFKYLPPERQTHYAESLPFDHHFYVYNESYEALKQRYGNDIPQDAELLLEFQHRERLRTESAHIIFQALNQEIMRIETRIMLNTYCFGNHLLSNNEQLFYAASDEYKQVRQYTHRLYNNLESKHTRIIEENNAHRGLFSSCRRISPDKIISAYEKENSDLRKEIRTGLHHFLSTQAPASRIRNHVRKLNQSLRRHYSAKVNHFFHYFPALTKIDLQNHDQLRRHFYKLFLETDKEIFNEKSNRKKKNDLIIQCLTMECYYLLDEFTSSLGYYIDFQEINRECAFYMASMIYKSYLENRQNTLSAATLNDFIVNYKKEIIGHILQYETERVFSNLTECERQLGYTHRENAIRSFNSMWSYTISSQAGRFAGQFLTRFFDSIGFLQAINTGTENDIALFFVAANATRISEEVSYIKRILFAIARMVLGPIKNELYQASLEPNPSLREIKLAAIILFYTAMIALAAIALASTAFMALFVGFEFIAVPIAIIIIIAAATLATKATFYLINTYHEWKDYSINQRMRDVLGEQTAEKVLMLYKNSIKSVDTMIAHLNRKTGLTQQELDFNDELEKLKIDLKNEWKKIRNDKTCPVENIKKIIKDRIKYFYDKEKSVLHARLQKEVTHRFDVQQNSLMQFCTQPLNNNPEEQHQDEPNYKKYIYSKNQVVFFKQRVGKLKNISDHLEEKHAHRRHG